MRDWSGTGAISLIVDRLMFVLSLFEIWHTVQSSVRPGELSPEPFLIVGQLQASRTARPGQPRYSIQYLTFLVVFWFLAARIRLRL
jgi:hypothetical protein